jgi:hypothetical protein
MVLATLAVAAPAAAHGASPRLLDVHAHAMAHAAAPVRSADGNRAVAASLLVGLALLVLARARRGLGPERRRRVLSLAVCLLLAVFAVETSVHSVHHLTDPRAASECSVLAGTQSLACDAAPTVVIARPPAVVGAAAPARSADSPRSLLHRPRPGRAPPA